MYIPKAKGYQSAVRMVAATALAAAILVSTSVPMRASGADQLTTLKNQYAALQQQQQQLQSKISSQNSQLESVNQQVSQLDASISLTNQQIAVLNEQIAATDAQLAAKAADIAATQKRVADNYALYKQRMRAMYESGDVSYVEVLLASSDLNDFLSRSEMLKSISVHDNDLINSLKADTERLKQDQAALQTDRNNLQASQGALAAKEETMNNQRAQQAQLVQQLKAGISSNQQQMTAAKQQAQQTDAQINAEMEAEAAARARQLAAQKAAAQKAAATQAPKVTNAVDTAPGSTAGSSTGGSPVAGSSVTGTALAGYATSFADGSHPYLLGSAGPKYYDCSGFTAKVYAWAGVYLAHSAASQATVGAYVDKNQLQVGDLVCFDTEHSGGITHVGIYIGGGQFVAANTSTGIAVASLSSSYWASAVRFGRRIL